MSARRLALALLAGALSCGGRVGEESSNPEPSSAAPRTVPATPPSYPNSRPQGSSPPSPPSVGAPPSMGPVATPPVPQPPEWFELERAAAENILLVNCGVCHGPAAPAATSGAIRFINDIDRLVDAGLIVPLSSATSLLIAVMRNGSMPPPSSSDPLLTEADIDFIARYIDNPRFWPDQPPPPPPELDAGAPTPVADASADAG